MHPQVISSHDIDHAGYAGHKHPKERVLTTCAIAGNINEFLFAKNKFSCQALQSTLIQIHTHGKTVGKLVNCSFRHGVGQAVESLEVKNWYWLYMVTPSHYCKLRSSPLIRYIVLPLSQRSEIWQVSPLYSCWDVCQISERSDSTVISPSFGISRKHCGLVNEDPVLTR